MANTLTCPFPANLDPLSPNGFQLTIAKLPGISFFCQEANIPSVVLPALGINTPLVKMNQPSDQLQYAPLDVKFMIDANMDNYAALLNWMEGLGFPEDRDQYREYQESQANGGLITGNYDFSAGTLIILGPNNHEVRRVDFMDLIPTSISSMVFTTKATDVHYLMGHATFAYTLFKLV